MTKTIKQEANCLMEELLATAEVKPGGLVVVGCSSSEIVGSKIGTGRTPVAAKAAYDGIVEALSAHGLFLAAQCCEHLNRALIVEREYAEKHALPIVTAVPYPEAGGSFATAAWQGFRDPCAVEAVQADAGLDIGGTLIGMHLKPVAVPVRLSADHLGSAIILAARTRPKYIGGERTRYE